MHSDLLRQGIAAAKAGDKPRARRLLLAATEERPDVELAWLWLASVAATREDTVAFLERALAINPADERAQSWLTHVNAQAAPPRRRWRCPLCGGEALVEVEKCPRCRAVVSLRDIGAVLANQDADRALLAAALERLEALTGDEVDFEVHLKIGLAYLNLKRVYEGITRLRVAVQLRPGDLQLKEQIAQLVRRQEESARLVARLAAPGKPATGKRTVLVVDDSPTVLKIVGMALARHGHEVVVAANAMQALAKLDEVLPDLVLLDINMPHMDGYQLCKLIRANPSTGELPVVMLSGKDGFFDRVRGKLAGSTDYLTKPFDPVTLVQVVERHCRARA
jgi:twitching motility two-component system response regulator PilG